MLVAGFETVSTSDSDREISDAYSSVIKSNTSDSGSENGATHVGVNWLQVIDCCHGPDTFISVQYIECKAIVPSSFDWTTQPVQCFSFFVTLIC
jgi:hypothetical protein